jgi:uncharacterized protein YrrD
MTSSGGESFTIGAHVDATDGRCGHLARLIVDPTAESLTHLVVEPGNHEERAQMVPVDLVASVGDDLIRLNCTKEEFEQLDPAEDIQFLIGGTPTYFAIDMPLGHGAEPMFIDRVPLGEVTVRRGDPVHASDGEIGAVRGLVIDPVGHEVTHVILKEGHLWGRKQVAIPIGSASRVDDEIRVDLTKGEIEALPPVGLSSP